MTGNEVAIGPPSLIGKQPVMENPVPIELGRKDAEAPHVLRAKYRSSLQIGRALGATEGSVRYRCK